MSFSETFSSRVIDLLLVVPGSWDLALGNQPNCRPIRKKFRLPNKLWLGRIPEKLSLQVIEACEQKHYNWNPIPFRSAAYAFIRECPPEVETKRHNWDWDCCIQRALALSRLIRPTATMLEYTARVFFRTDKTVDYIHANTNRENVVHGYLADPKTIVWLTEVDARCLKGVLLSYFQADLPGRIRNALWFHEFLHQIFWIEIRWPLLITALEALPHTDRQRSTFQFKKRIPVLCKVLGFATITEKKAAKAYGIRSGLVHHGGVENPFQEKSLYQRLESLLRATILRAITDVSFRDHFSNSQRVKEMFPL